MLSLDIINKIPECSVLPWRAKDKRDERLATHFLVHRNDVGRTPEDVMDFFTHKDKSTGGRFPYHYFIGRDGTVYQTASLTIATPGAAGANRISIQACLDGDFRKHKPSEAQWESLIKLTALHWLWKPSLFVEGHTERPGRSADPKKVCPGDKLSLPALRLAALEVYERESKARLRLAGVRV